MLKLNIEIKFNRKNQKNSLIRIGYNMLIENLCNDSLTNNNYWLDRHFSECIGYIRALTYTNTITQTEDNRLYQIASDIRFSDYKEENRRNA